MYKNVNTQKKTCRCRSLRLLQPIDAWSGVPPSKQGFCLRSKRYLMRALGCYSLRDQKIPGKEELRLPQLNPASTIILRLPLGEAWRTPPEGRVRALCNVLASGYEGIASYPQSRARYGVARRGDGTYPGPIRSGRRRNGIPYLGP